MNGPGGKNFNLNFFRFVHPVLMILIIFGMSVLYYFAFYDYIPIETMRCVSMYCILYSNFLL
jgi:hypothetical protein